MIHRKEEGLFNRRNTKIINKATRLLYGAFRGRIYRRGSKIYNIVKKGNEELDKVNKKFNTCLAEV